MISQSTKIWNQQWNLSSQNSWRHVPRVKPVKTSTPSWHQYATRTFVTQGENHTRQQISLPYKQDSSQHQRPSFSAILLEPDSTYSDNVSPIDQADTNEDLEDPDNYYFEEYQDPPQYSENNQPDTVPQYSLTTFERSQTAGSIFLYFVRSSYPNNCWMVSFWEPREINQSAMWPGVSRVPYPETGIFDLLLLVLDVSSESRSYKCGMSLKVLINGM